MPVFKSKNKVKLQRPKRKVKVKDLIYLAAYLDGEGCFTTESKGLTAYVTCNATYRPTMLWIVETFGGTLTIKPTKDDHHKTQWAWYKGPPDCYVLCSLLTPYLKEKKKQAELIVEHQSASFKKKKRIRQQLKKLKHANL